MRKMKKTNLCNMMQLLDQEIDGQLLRKINEYFIEENKFSSFTKFPVRNVGKTLNKCEMSHQFNGRPCEHSFPLNKDWYCRHEVLIKRHKEYMKRQQNTVELNINKFKEYL